MTERNVNTSDTLSIEISSEDLKFVDTTPQLSISEGLEVLNFLINTSDILSIEVNTYYPDMPIFQIVLDFIIETGGVY